jgi:hypothetical protein
MPHYEFFCHGCKKAFSKILTRRARGVISPPRFFLPVIKRKHFSSTQAQPSSKMNPTTNARMGALLGERTSGDAREETLCFHLDADGSSWLFHRRATTSCVKTDSCTAKDGPVSDIGFSPVEQQS